MKMLKKGSIVFTGKTKIIYPLSTERAASGFFLLNEKKKKKKKKNKITIETKKKHPILSSS